MHIYYRLTFNTHTDQTYLFIFYASLYAVFDRNLQPPLSAVIWRNAVDSLTAAHKYYLYTPAPNSTEMADIVANDLLTP